uniref:Uncharacterized protein n=1 Tax=viral metagenome TaxID=1070528 RepID=A0A6C0L905_9ZZZZ
MSILDKLSVLNPVIIRPKPEMCHPTWENKNFRYEGTVKNIRYHYINGGAKQFGKEKVVYISFMDLEAYNNLLLQGSHIMCYVHNTLMTCYITTIARDSSNKIYKLEVAIYDDENIIRPYPIVYNINVSNIDSMLITEKMYQIQKF